MKILITNRTMSIRNGAETYVQDLAMELLAQGHRPMVYTAEVGATGRELIDLTIPVTDDLDTLGVRPDVIHGQHFMTAMTALAYFRDVPMVGVSHGWRPWTETPIRHPNVVRYVAVDEAVRDRLSLQHGIEDDRISIVHNSVDLERFQRTAAPGESLRRMLLFSNYVLKGSPYFLAAHQAAEELGVELDVVGTGTNSQTSAPEKILGDYDLVLAQGRSAIEAMAAGASVMIGSSRAFGPLVRPDNVEHPHPDPAGRCLHHHLAAGWVLSRRRFRGVVVDPRPGRRSGCRQTIDHDLRRGHRRLRPGVGGPRRGRPSNRPVPHRSHGSIPRCTS